MRIAFPEMEGHPYHPGRHFLGETGLDRDLPPAGPYPDIVAIGNTLAFGVLGGNISGFLGKDGIHAGAARLGARMVMVQPAPGGKDIGVLLVRDLGRRCPVRNRE